MSVAIHASIISVTYLWFKRDSVYRTTFCVLLIDSDHEISAVELSLCCSGREVTEGQLLGRDLRITFRKSECLEYLRNCRGSSILESSGLLTFIFILQYMHIVYTQSVVAIFMLVSRSSLDCLSLRNIFYRKLINYSKYDSCIFIETSVEVNCFDFQYKRLPLIHYITKVLLLT